MGRVEGRQLVIRADASTQIGTGHFMRCLALAQAWKDCGREVAYITCCRSEVLLERLRTEGFDIHLLTKSYPDTSDWGYTASILNSYPEAWVVLDGYHFDEAYQQHVKKAGHKLLVIDDMASLKHYYADIVLNQNLHADQLHYSCEPYAKVLLGTCYTLLRREFLTWRDWKREIPEIATHVLVTLGGGDAENHTLRVIQALQGVNVSGVEATVVIGAGNPNIEVLETATKQSYIPVRLVHNARNMPELMAWADMAVSAAGTTIWELLFLGTAILAFVAVENQRHVAEQLVSRGIGRSLGKPADIPIEVLAEAITSLLRDFDSRTKMRENGRRIVDGQGSQRVVAVMHETECLMIMLRLATSEDCRMVWEWANEPAVRAASFNSNPIGWDEHAEWFKTRLQNSSCFYYIVLNDKGLPIGQVRFDLAGKEAEINISISSRFRGHGLGAKAIQVASERLFCETGVIRINAHIKQGNETSVRAFAKAGYVDIGVKVVKGQKARRMTLARHSGLSKNGSCQD